MAFGANMFQWGYEAGQEAVRFLRTGKIPAPVKLQHREKLINTEKAARFGIQADSTFSAIP
jgi:putative ABC transport system substrate-binding protein